MILILTGDTQSYPAVPLLLSTEGLLLAYNMILILTGDTQSYPAVPLLLSTEGLLLAYNMILILTGDTQSYPAGTFVTVAVHRRANIGL